MSLRPRVWIMGAAVGAFLLTAVLPVAHMILTTVGNVSAGVLLLDARQRSLLANSALFATSSAVLATLIGVPLGYGLARIPARRKAAIRAALAAPVVLPPYIVALAWVYVASSAGDVAALVGRDRFAEWTYSLPAAAFVLALVYYPIVMLATEVALRQVDPHLEEAALIVARPQRVLAWITFPLIAPAVAGAALIVFVLAVSEFGVPALLRVRVYTTEVFTAFAALFDFPRATALMLPLLVIVAVPSALAASLLGSRVIAGQRVSVAEPGEVSSLRRPIQILGLAVIVVALILPTLVLVREAEDVVAAARGSWPSIRVSLLLAAVGATLVVAIGGTLGYGRARTTPRLGRLADVVWVMLFAVPSTIVGVALIGIWNRPGPMGVLYGTTAMFVLAYLARFVPVAALIVAASVRQVPVSHEEAAAVAGANWLRTMRAVVLPQVAPGLTAAWVVAFVFAFGELGASILISPPGESTLPIRIYTLIANTPSSVVAALALLQVAVIGTPLLAAIIYFVRRTE